MRGGCPSASREMRRRGKRRGRADESATERAGDGERRGRVERHVASAHAEPHVDRPPRRARVNAGPGELVERRSSSTRTSAVDARPERQDRAPACDAHRHDPLVVGVEDRGAVGGSASTSSPFARATPSMPPTQFGVRAATAVTTPIDGRADVAQPRDLAEPAHAHLEHQHLGVVGRAEDRHRQALLVVEAPLVGGHPHGRRRARRRRGPWCSSCRRCR